MRELIVSFATLRTSNAGRQFLSRGQSPHPKAQQTEDDDKDPARFNRNDMRRDVYLPVLKQSHDMNDRDQSENYRRNPQTISL
jgi:hypothetical protein